MRKAGEPKGRAWPLSEHSQSVAGLCAAYGSAIGMQAACRWIGW